VLLITGMLSPYASVVEKLHKDTDKDKVSMMKIERAGDVLADAPAKVAQSILLFCKGQGLLTSVVMPGVDRQRAFSTSSGGSNGERRLSRGKDENTSACWDSAKWMRKFQLIFKAGMSMEEYDKPNIRRLSITVNDQLPPIQAKK
jgi:protein NDRG1